MADENNNAATKSSNPLPSIDGSPSHSSSDPLENGTASCNSSTHLMEHENRSASVVSEASTIVRSNLSCRVRRKPTIESDESVAAVEECNLSRDLETPASEEASRSLKTANQIKENPDVDGSVCRVVEERTWRHESPPIGAVLLAPSEPQDKNVSHQLTSALLEDFSRLEQQGRDDDGLVGSVGAYEAIRFTPLGNRPSSQTNGAAHSEVLSTASEMGTVIETPASAFVDPRLAQLTDMLLDSHETPVRESKCDYESSSSCTPKRVAPDGRSYHYESIFGAESGVVSSDAEDDELALPLLDGKFHHDEKKSTETPRSRPLHPSFVAPQSPGKSIISRTMTRLANTLASSSAPNTPCELPRTSFSPPSRVVARGARAAEVTPPSFLLRSPGSSVYHMATQCQRNESTPSYSDLQYQRFVYGKNDAHRAPLRRSRSGSQRLCDSPGEASPRTSQTGQPSHFSVTPQQRGIQAYRHIMTRACFSFDAYDTCDDRVYEFPVQSASSTYPSISPSELLQSPTNLAHSDDTSKPQHVSSSAGNANTDDTNWIIREPNVSTASKPLLRACRSWDGDDGVGRVAGYGSKGGDGITPCKTEAIPIPIIRTRSYIKSANSIIRTKQPSSFAFPRTIPEIGLVSPPRASKWASYGTKETSTASCRPDKDLAYRRSLPRSSWPSSRQRMLPRLDDLELRSPLRFDVEREDALDILSCLVERGIRFKGVDIVADSVTPDHSDVAAAVLTLKRLVLDCSVPSVRETCLRTLEELLCSHEYALEMRRASLSAYSWLRSIGRTSSPTSPTQHGQYLDPPQHSFNEFDLPTARAMLHATRVELEEKSKVANRLNAELAKCRAEIGRLRSSNSIGASMNSSFRSPNRSILDESDDLSTGETDVEGDLDQSLGGRSPISDKANSECLDTSFEDIIPLHHDHGDTAKFQAALEEANDTIRKLHALVKKQSAAGIDSDAALPFDDDPPIVNVSGATKVASLIQRLPEAGRIDQTSSALRCDSENYVTDWEDLQPSLPPPPDHGLRSPIVVTLLEQWTTDRSLQECLLSWMDHILSGADPLNVPPLTLTSLNHQVRDGFITHVLPLLLRRPGVSIDVKVRAQRLTTYDLAVSIEPIIASSAQSPFLSSGAPWRQQLETTSAQSEVGETAASATHSAVTALISNSHHVLSGDALPTARAGGAASSRLSYDEVADHVNWQPQSGLMSALGGALGFLGRRKAYAVGVGGPEPLPSVSSAVSDTTSSDVVPTPSSAVHIAFGEEDDSMQPYHRVLAAPPGRLGMTIVEYRGHAMVSAVSTDSPLVGWIFPSDILIAIDEMPISGMRVRDIIQILKDRQGRQRALRVISSHNMTELTVNNTSAVMHDST